MKGPIFRTIRLLDSIFGQCNLDFSCQRALCKNSHLLVQKRPILIYLGQQWGDISNLLGGRIKDSLLGVGNLK